jgi:hypothetical protein
MRSAEIVPIGDRESPSGPIEARQMKNGRCSERQ